MNTNHNLNSKIPTSWLLHFFALGLLAVANVNELKGQSPYVKSNLVAWCIVPFDANKRNPLERAQMLKRLGIKKVAYDWRQEHVKEFEQEILEYKKHDLDYFAFWSVHEEAFRLFEKHDIHPQIWVTMTNPNKPSQAEKVEAAANQLLPLVERTKAIGCKLGLYNHGGWSGEPENMVAVCKWLRKTYSANHVGIVYNMHHGHGHITRFPEVLKLMKPYLICLNLNGMNDGANPKILPIGDGKHEGEMLKAIKNIDYKGPIGILDHRSEIDAEKSLLENLSGLKKLLYNIGEEQAAQTFD